MQNTESNTDWKESAACLCLPEQIAIENLSALIKQQSWLKLPVQMADFSQVKKADSAILAVLLAWNNVLDHKLKVKNVPAELLTLVDLYDLQDVFEFID